MQRYNQFHPILISDFESSHWQHPAHNHNHYELIYIKRGSGKHIINRNSFDYGKGNIFLLGPQDYHEFDITETTHFIYLKFTDLYIKSNTHEQKQWVQDMEYLIKNKEVRLSKFNISAADQNIADAIYNVILQLKSSIMQNEGLIYLQIMALSALLKRNLPEVITNASHATGAKNVEEIFAYIHTNIYNPELIKLKILAARFNTTVNYIGPFFKRNTGITLRDYIMEYRRNLIQKRLASYNYSLKEIASEFGLTDESHLSKLLKNNR